MGRVRTILAGLGTAIVVIAVFLATEIADSEGRTLADRTPVVGSLLRAVGLGGGHGPNGPILQAYDAPQAILAATTCGDLRRADGGTRERFARAFIQVGARDDPRFDAVDPAELLAVIDISCSDATDATLAVEAPVRPAS